MEQIRRKQETVRLQLVQKKMQEVLQKLDKARKAIRHTIQQEKDNQISELPEDKENTTDDEWYEEGIYIEPYSQSDNNSIDEDDEYADIRVTNADIDAYRKVKGIEKTLDPKTGIPLNTITIDRTNVPGLEN